MKRLISLLAAVAVISSSTAPSTADSELVEIRQEDISSTLVEGGRGAALAVLEDGTALLAGGKDGDTLFQWRNGKLTVIGKILQQKERFSDSRFGPTDIGILTQSANSAQLLISYPQLSSSGQCIRLVVNRYIFNRSANSLSKKERWFTGKPCVPVGAIQHAAGRIEVINKQRAYLTTGDLGFRKINERAARGWLGGVFEISAKKVKQISQGHRNPQGVLLIGKDLYISEHGPRGGDEINLIMEGKDYGWPFVTYGAAYSSGDYVRPTNSGTHQGFTKPLYQWTPSVAPTELVLIPNLNKWGNLKNYMVMGSLAAQTLYFIELSSKNAVTKVSEQYVGERIRDLDVLPNGDLVATTDRGALLLIAPK